MVITIKSITSHCNYVSFPLYCHFVQQRLSVYGFNNILNKKPICYRSRHCITLQSTRLCINPMRVTTRYRLHRAMKVLNYPAVLTEATEQLKIWHDVSVKCSKYFLVLWLIHSPWLLLEIIYISLLCKLCMIFKYINKSVKYIAK